MGTRSRIQLRHGGNVPLYRIIAARIIDYLERHDMTASELARNADVTKMAVSQYVNEKRHRPEATTLEKISKAMPGVDLTNRLVQMGAGPMELKLLNRTQKKELDRLASDPAFAPDTLDTTPPLSREQVQRQQRQRKVTAKMVREWGQTFSRNLADWMAATKTTQTDMAKRTGISQPLISDYVHGRSEPSVTKARAIATAMGVRLDDMFSKDFAKFLGYPS